MALTRVAPAGIGSTPGTGYVIGDSFLHSRGLNAIDANYTGIVTAQSIRVIGDLQVDGTTTTLDTAVTEVDKLEVGANNNTVGVAITQSGTGDILNLYDGSTQVVTVEDGGRVGIGTQNPTGILDVHKGSSTAYDSTDDNAQRADSASITIRNDNGSTNTFSQLVFDTGGSNQSIARIVAIRSGTASNHLAFVTEHSNTKAERLRIDSNGRLSLNDNSRPASDASEGAQLRVTGTPLTRNQYYSPAGDYFGSFGYTDNTYTKSWISVDSSYNKASAVSSGIFLSSFHADAGSSPCGHTIKNERTDAGGLIFSSVATAASVNNPAVETERLRIKTNGNIGIGTNNPAQKLHIWGNSATTALSIGDNSLTEPYVLLEANATDNVSTLHSRGNHALTFKIQQSEKVRIQNDGKVGIGTVSPTHSLSSFGSGNSGGVRIENTHDTTTVSGNTASSAFPHNLILTNYESQVVGSANRMASLGFDIPTPGGSHANATIAYQATNSSGNGDLQFWLEQNNTPIERLRITSDGKIGIGDATPDNTLSIKGIGSFDGDSNSFYFGSNFTGTGQNYIGSSKHAQRFFLNNASANGYFSYSNTGSAGTAGDAITWQERFRITSGGNIGVGGATGTDFSLLDGIVTNTANGSAGLLINSSSSSHNAYLGFSYGSGSGTSHADQYSAYIGRVGDDTLILGTNNNIRLSITSTGELVSTNGTLRRNVSSGSFTVSGDTASNAGANINLYGASHSSLANVFRVRTGSTERFRVTSDGKMGVGTQSPDVLLHLSEDNPDPYNTVVTHLKLNNGGGNGGSGSRIELKTGAARCWIQSFIDGANSGSGGALVFGTPSSGTLGTERLRITSAGNVGIGTNNPISKLEVNGDIGVQNNQVNTSSIVKLFSPSHNTANRGARIRIGLNDGSFGGMEVENVQGDNASYNSQTIRILTHNGGIAGDIEALTVKYNGNVGIRTDNPTESLYVNGTTRLGGGVDYGSTTLLSLAPGVVKWDTPGQSGGRLNADASGNWYLNNKSYPIYDNLGLNMNDIYGANSAANNIGGWVYLGATQHSAPYPRKVYKISGPNTASGTFVYQVWFNGDANYQHGGLYEIRINNWNESTRFTSVTITCINGVSDGLRVYAYNDANGIWITTNSIWGSLYIRKFGYDDSRRSRGASLCAVDNGGHLGVADVNGLSGTIPSGYTEVHASDSGGGGYNIENNSRFGAGGN